MRGLGPVRRIAVLSIFAAGMTMARSPPYAANVESPLRFFEGRTEMVSQITVLMKRPYRSLTLGNGLIMADGSLTLNQDVHDDSKPTHHRIWKIRQVGPGMFAGSMSDAIDKVEIQEISGNFRFRFRMNGNLSVEQWLIPMPGGRVARSTSTIRKFGIRVATSNGTIRRT